MFDSTLLDVSPVAAIAFGAVLLFAGRRLYWLFVGVVGFLMGLALAFNYLSLDSRGLELLVALIAGGIGVSLAVALQKVAVALAGFVVGGYGLHALLFDSGTADGVFSSTEIGVFLLGGVIAAVVSVAIFGGALVVMTSMFGATLITQGAALDGEQAAVVFGVLFALGVAFQLGFGRRKPKRGKRAEDYEN